ncbi:MAG: hypothetical protein CML01_12295 [Pseudomonas sp.]|nr:hypothetical protein [Pseudomonas sp.]
MSRIEQHIVRAWASRLAATIVKEVISDLESMDAMLSGDSGLANVWEEICAQVQKEESYQWAVYEDVIESLLYACLEELDRDAQLALWTATDAGWDYIYDHHADSDGSASVPLSTDDIVCKLASDVLSAAADYESPSLFRFKWGEDDPQCDEDGDEYGDESDKNDLDGPVVFSIHRQQIEAFDLESSLSFLRTLVPANDPQLVWSFKGFLSLVIAGYDDDSRELYAIPEVCRYLHGIDQEWPFWFFFLTPGDGSVKLVGMCLASAITVTPGKAYIPPEKLQRFMERGFGAVNRIFDHYSFPESENEAITEAVSQVFIV